MKNSRVFFRTAVAILVPTLGLSASACASPSTEVPPPVGTPPASSPATTSEASATNRPCPAPAPASLTVGTDKLPDGQHFGFIQHFDGTTLYVDPAEIFANEAAEKAAKEDDEVIGDPVYIRNPDTTLVRVPTSADFTIQLVDNTNGPQHRLTASEFAELYCGKDAPAWLYANPTQLPARLTVSGGTASTATEEYLP